MELPGNKSHLQVSYRHKSCIKYTPRVVIVCRTCTKEHINLVNIGFFTKIELLLHRGWKSTIQGFSVGKGGELLPWNLFILLPPEIFDTKRVFNFLTRQIACFSGKIQSNVSFHPVENFNFYPPHLEKTWQNTVYSYGPRMTHTSKRHRHVRICNNWCRYDVDTWFYTFRLHVKTSKKSQFKDSIGMKFYLSITQTHKIAFVNVTSQSNLEIEASAHI